MNFQAFTAEAEHCREMATALADRNERSFLLSVARAFDDLATERKNGQSRDLKTRRASDAIDDGTPASAPKGTKAR